MLIISHRGLLNGPNKDIENHPEQIQKCIDIGYDVEVDLRYKDGLLYLGHDFAQYEISFEWLTSRKNTLWIHCKDAETLFFMSDKNKGFNGFNYFFHDKDDFTITSKGIIWCYPYQPYNKNSVILMPEWYLDVLDFHTLKNYQCYAICTDYPNLL